MTVLALLFNHSALATSLFDGINAKGVMLSTDEKLKNKFCSIIGLDPSTGDPDIAAGTEFAEQWELLETQLLECRRIFGAKFPAINEYLGILLSVYLQDGSRTQFKESEIVARFEMRFERRIGATSEARKAFAEAQRKDARKLLKTATLSLKILKDQARQPTKQGQQVRYSLESIGTAMGAMYGFSMPLAYLFKLGTALDPKVLSETCRISEIATFRLLKTRALKAGAYKNVMIDNAITIFETGNLNLAKSQIRESFEHCKDSELVKYLTTESFKDSSLAFYVVNKLGRLTSADQRRYFIGLRDDWEIEHITPQKMSAYWGFSDHQERLFTTQSLNQLGNLLVVNDELNGHVKNHRLDFKLSGKNARICGQDCHRHYANDSVCMDEMRDFRAWKTFQNVSTTFSVLLGDSTVKVAKGAGGVGAKKACGSELFTVATQFVTKRSRMLAERAVAKQVWNI